MFASRILSSCRNGLHGTRCFNNTKRPTRRSIRGTEIPRSDQTPSGALVKGFNLPSFPPANWSSLVKPGLFTISFTGSAFGLAAIWQYESMRESMISQKSKSSIKRMWSAILSDRNKSSSPEDLLKAGEWRSAICEWWNTKLSEGQKTFAPICALNILVFCLWRVPGLRSVMSKYFMSNPAAPNNCWPMLLSAFSHFSVFHLAANMFVLHSFSTSIVTLLGREQFVAFYLSTAVFSSFCSHVFKVVSGRNVMSLGASGAICAVLGVFGTLVPNATLEIIFLPMIQFSASTGIKGLIALDTAGLIARWNFFDHAAHLGGMLSGIWYCHQGHSFIWDNREPLMTWWHTNVRSRAKPT